MDFYKKFFKPDIFYIQDFDYQKNFENFENNKKLVNLLEPYQLHSKIKSIQPNSENKYIRHRNIYNTYTNYVNYNNKGCSKVLKSVNGFHIYPDNISIGNDFTLYLENHSKISIENGAINLPRRGLLHISSIELDTGIIYF